MKHPAGHFRMACGRKLAYYKAHFPADTTIELAGMESPIYG